MWIRGRSSATSSAAEGRAWRGALLAPALAALAAGCIVTDEIDFEDKVNHAPEVVSLDPSNGTVATVCPDDLAFSVVIWDADEGDSATYEAKLQLKLNPYSGGPWSVAKDCDLTELTTFGEENENLSSGVLLDVGCELDLSLYVEAAQGALLMVQVQVSDWGYSQNVVREGARTAEVLWLLEVAPESVCVE